MDAKNSLTYVNESCLFLTLRCRLRRIETSGADWCNPTAHHAFQAGVQNATYGDNKTETAANRATPATPNGKLSSSKYQQRGRFWRGAHVTTSQGCLAAVGATIQ